MVAGRSIWHEEEQHLTVATSVRGGFGFLLLLGGHCCRLLLWNMSCCSCVLMLQQLAGNGVSCSLRWWILKSSRRSMWLLSQGCNNSYKR